MFRAVLLAACEHGWLLLALGTSLLTVACGQPAADGGSSRYALIADAGSTGTRVYLYSLASEKGAHVDVEVLGKGPALSSFADKPEAAKDTVKAQLEKARSIIPVAVQPSVPVAVYGTAGMRLLDADVALRVYDGLRTGLLADGFPFDQDALQARTISGREEGLWALLAANYLAGRLSTSLHSSGKGQLLGVMDLGGSSTQIAVPPAEVSANSSLLPRLGPEETYIQSFLSLGMERMRQRTYRQFSLTPGSENAVANPCAFPGLESEDPEMHSWRGTGTSSDCEAAVRKELAQERSTCLVSQPTPGSTSRPSCLPTEAVKPPRGSSEAASFFLISGYLYVLDFARWWDAVADVGEPTAALQRLFHRPRVDKLREAAKRLCASPWETILATATDESRKHKFTQAHKVPHRCFELNYIIALLTEGFGFPEDGEDLFQVVAEVDGKEIDWTLGGFLYLQALADAGQSATGDAAPGSGEL